MWDTQHHHLSSSMIPPTILMPWSYIAQTRWLMSRGVTPTTTGLPHLPLRSLFLLRWKWKPRLHNRTKMSSCGLAKFRVLYFCMDCWKLGLFSESNTAILLYQKLFVGLNYLHPGGKIHCGIKTVTVVLSYTVKVKLWADLGQAGGEWY